MAAFEIVLLSTASSAVILIAIWLAGSDRVGNRLSTMGATVLDHIGWTFGVYVPVLLGFYVVVIGGQLEASPAVAGTVRRRLGTVAEVMAALLGPALVVIVAACIDVPARSGALLVILPATALVLFLAIQLGGFIVFERDVQLAAARAAHAWAEQRMPLLRVRSRRPVVLVWFANALVAALAALTTDSLFRLADQSEIEPNRQGLALGGFFVVTAVVSGVSVLTVDTAYTARSRWERASPVIATSLLYAAAVLAIVSVFLAGRIAWGFTVLAPVVMLAASTLWPRRWSPQRLLNWTIRGAGIRWAASDAGRSYRRSMRTIRDLSPADATPARASLRDRLRRARHAMSAQS